MTPNRLTGVPCWATRTFCGGIADRGFLWRLEAEGGTEGMRETEAPGRLPFIEGAPRFPSLRDFGIEDMITLVARLRSRISEASVMLEASDACKRKR